MKDSFVEAIIAVTSGGDWLPIKILNNPNEIIRESFLNERREEDGLKVNFGEGVFKTTYYPKEEHHHTEYNPRTEEWEETYSWIEYNFGEIEETFWKPKEN